MLFNRQIEVLIGDKNKGLLIRDLKMQFSIVKSISKEPNECTLKIFNLPKNELRALNINYLDCIINAGYVNQVGNIFNGQIDSYKFTKQDNDVITEITIKDGGKNFYTHIANFTISKNTTDNDILNKLGLPAGQVDNLNSTNRVRGRVVSCASRDILTNLASKHDCEWSYQDNKLQFLGKNKVLNNDIIQLSYKSGLITEPEAIDDGIKFTCLLNPMLKIGGRVQLVDVEINKTTSRKSSSSQHSGDGVYKIVKITFNGDNTSTGLDFNCEVEVKNV